MHLYLVDGYGFVFRAYHSLPPLSSPDGKPIGAVYGFINMILKLIEEHTQPKADHDYMLAVVLDSGGKNHRHALFNDYKANRLPPADDLISQFPIIREALSALHIHTLEMPNTEADDIIASYAVQAAQQGHEVTIISADKDLMQLLAYPNIKIHDPLKNKAITTQTVLEKFGVTPSQLTEAFALIGDSSDNIPGVPGIGPKTAADLLNQFSSIENLYQHLDEIKSVRIKNLLVTNKDTLILSKKLVELKIDLDPTTPLQELFVKEIDKPKVLDFANKFGFKSLISKFKLSQGNLVVKSSVALQELKTLAELKEFTNTLKYDGIFAIFINDQALFLVSNSRYCTIKCEKTTQIDLFDSEKSLLSLSSIISILKPVLADESIKKICFQAKNLMHELGLNPQEIRAVEDLALINYVISTKNQHRHVIELLQDDIANGANIINIYNDLSSQIHSAKLHNLYESIEKPLLPILYNIETKGMMIDRGVLHSLSIEFQDKANILKNNIYQLSGVEFNIASAKQLGEVLFDKMGIPGGKKSSKSGAYTTDSETLDALASQGHTVAQSVLEWRHLTKLANTYTEPLQRLINPITGRLHTTFEMTNTTTGRLSSHNPNLQNIPIRTPEGQKIRRAFIASPGNSIISADYSQIELRLLAHFAGIDELKQVFMEDQDIHSVTASEIFKVPLSEVNEDLRRKAKGINFGIIYGISPFGLSRNIGISTSEAKQYIDYYFLRYPGIKQYMEKYIALAKQHGFVETILKRRCAIEGINSSNYLAKSFAERAAINAPLQGSASDIIKKAMVIMPESLKKFIVLQIHDELLFDIPNEIAEESAVNIKKIMEEAVTLNVPMKVNISISKSWG